MSHLAWLLIAPMLVLATSGQGIAQWTFTQTGGPFGGNVLNIAQSVDGSIFICTSDGVFRSMDNGSTWKRVHHPSQKARKRQQRSSRTRRRRSR